MSQTTQDKLQFCIETIEAIKKCDKENIDIEDHYDCRQDIQQVIRVLSEFEFEEREEHEPENAGAPFEQVNYEL